MQSGKLFSADRLHSPLTRGAGDRVLQLDVGIGQLRGQQQLAAAVGLRIHLAAAETELAIAAIEVGRRHFGEVVGLAALAYQQLRTVPVQQDLRLADIAGDHHAVLVDEEAADAVVAQRRPFGMGLDTGCCQHGSQQYRQMARGGRGERSIHIGGSASRQLIIMASMATSSSSSSISVMLQKSSSAIIRCSIERSLAAMSNLRIAKN